MPKCDCINYYYFHWIALGTNLSQATLRETMIPQWPARASSKTGWRNQTKGSSNLLLLGGEGSENLPQWGMQHQNMNNSSSRTHLVQEQSTIKDGESSQNPLPPIPHSKKLFPVPGIKESDCQDLWIHSLTSTFAVIPKRAGLGRSTCDRAPIPPSRLVEGRRRSLTSHQYKWTKTSEKHKRKKPSSSVVLQSFVPADQTSGTGPIHRGKSA